MIKTPRDFMFDDLEDEQVQEEWLTYLETMAKEKEENEDE